MFETQYNFVVISGDSLGYVMILFITYGWAVIPMMYLFSFFFEVASTAFVRMTILNIITGLATLLIVYILSIPSIGLVDVAHALKWAFLVLPNYNLGQAMIDLFNNYQFQTVFESEDPVAMCIQFLRRIPDSHSLKLPVQELCQASLSTYHKGRIDVAACIKDDFEVFSNLPIDTVLCNGIQKFLINATSNFQYNYLAWQNPGIGRYLVFLTIEGFVFFSIVLMIEYRVLGGFFKSIVSGTKRAFNRCLELTPVVVVARRNNGSYDSDVVNEKVRIDNQPVNNHVLMLKDLTKIFHPRTGKLI